MESLPKINLSEMIHLDKVENVLNQILTRMDNQDILIRDLQQFKSTCISRSTFEK